MIKIFDLKEQYKQFGKVIDKKVISILSSGNYILGNNVELFEENVKNYLNGKYTLSCNSGTDALVLSLRALGIKTGDEIITTLVETGGTHIINLTIFQEPVGTSYHEIQKLYIFLK